MFVAIVLFITFISKRTDGVKDGFSNAFELKEGNDIYDTFYSSIYDHLVYNNAKDEFEIGTIVKNTHPTPQSNVLDIGCGTGHHVAALAKQGLNVTGVDISPAMLQQASLNYPHCKFEVGDVQNTMQFAPNSFTHLLCMYFTLYYIKDKARFFENCMGWLQPGGVLVVHIVDRDEFDPILPPGNRL